MIFLLVHGAWHGGWCWSQVADILEADGHDAIAMTMTGLGARAAELTPQVDLDTHVHDVVAAADAAGLQDFVLVGHSYAGMVVTDAAVLLGDRVRDLVVVDGFVPLAGECAVDLLPPHIASYYRDSPAKGDGFTVPPRPAGALGVTDPRVVEAHARLTPHPYRTYATPSRHGADQVSAHGTYLLCAGWDTPFRPYAERAEALGWDRRDLAADHQVILSDPELLAKELLQLV